MRFVRNWLAARATFKKKAKTDAKTSGLGFAAVLQASHSWSRGSLDDEDDSASITTSACLEALIVEVVERDIDSDGYAIHADDAAFRFSVT